MRAYETLFLKMLSKSFIFEGKRAEEPEILIGLESSERAEIEDVIDREARGEKLSDEQVAKLEAET